MSVNTKGLCAAIVLISIVVPIFVAHVMPYDYVEQTGYESSNKVNISGDLINSTINVYDDLISDINNKSILLDNPIRTGTVKTPIPVMENQVTGTHPAGSIYFANYTTNTVFEPTEYYEENFSIISNGVEYRGAIVYWYPDDDLCYLDIVGDGLVQIDPHPMAFTALHEYKTTEYVPSTTTFAQPLFGASLTANSTWFNGYQNGRASFIITDLGVLNSYLASMTITTIDPDGNVDQTKTVYISYSNGVFSFGNQLNNYTVLGQYKQVLLVIDSLNDYAELSGLVYNSNYSVDPTPRILNTVNKSMGYDGNELITSISIHSSQSGKNAAIYCYSTGIPLTTQRAIVDNSLNIVGYYGNTTLSYEIGDVAFYGSSIEIPGVTGQIPIVNGKITLNDVNLESHTFNIKQSVFFAIYDSVSNTYTIKLNNVEIANNVAPGNMTFSFNGKWLFNSYLYSISEYTYHEYLYDFANFNIDMNSFCLIGMLTSALAFVVAALIGRKSGTKVIWLGAISLLTFVVYASMLT